MKQKKEDKREKVGVLTTGLAEQGIFLSFAFAKSFRRIQTCSSERKGLNSD